MLTILTLLLLTSSSAQPVRHFQKLDKKSVPFTLFRDQHKTFDHEDATEASVAFLNSAAGVAFAGDLNDDGTDELLIVPDDGTCGSSGCEFYLFGDKEGTWVALAGTDGGIARDQSNGLDILPIVRRGYHDIRILDDCVKWNGRRYVPYEPADYRQLSPDWFDHSDFWSAVILWRIECEGLQTIKIVPQWVTGVPQGISNAELDDPDYNIKWIAAFNGGVYGISDNKSFLLLNTPGHFGAEKLEIEGDSLLVYAQSADDAVPVARYDRRSRELKILGK